MFYFCFLCRFSTVYLLPYSTKSNKCCCSHVSAQSFYSESVGRNEVFVLHASNDGKKKHRALKSNKATPTNTQMKSEKETPLKSHSDAPNNSIPSPQRVTNKINIPVRQQIAWAKAYKRLMTASISRSSSPPKRFKKIKDAKDEVEEYKEIDYLETKPPAVFVDGYNIIGYINSVEGRSIELSEARDCLISDLSILTSATGWCIEVVFDAYKVASPGGSINNGNIQITYTSSSETADNYIERRFSELQKIGFSNMIVATDDKVLQMVAGSNGMGHISAHMLLEELRIAYRGWDQLAVESIQVAKRFRPKLGDSLSDEMKKAIELLRQKK